MADINETFEIMIAEMQQYGASPAPSKGGSYNNLLQYRETREKIIDRFLAAFAEGYRLGKEDVEAEPLTIEQLRQMDGQPVWDENGKCYLVNTTYRFCSCSDIEIAIVATNGEIKRYPQRYVLYRRPPERQEDNNETS